MRLFWMTSCISMYLTGIGCMPGLRVENEGECAVRFLDESTKQPIEEVLVIPLREDYIGILGPDGGLSPGTFYLGNLSIHKGKRPLPEHFSIVAAISPFFYFMPIGYGGRTETRGYLVLTPGYQAVYTRGNQEEIFLPMAEQAHQEAQSCLRLLARRTLAPHDALEWPVLRTMPYGREGEMPTIQVRLSTSERKTVEDFLRNNHEHRVIQPYNTCQAAHESGRN